MIEGIEKYYQIIADEICNSIPEEWTTARMDAIFFAGSSEYTGEYATAVDGKARDFATTGVAERAFRDLRKAFKAAGKPLWGQACFELTSMGQFKMKWGYENCDENGDTIFEGEEEYLKRAQERHQRLTEN